MGLALGGGGRSSASVSVGEWIWDSETWMGDLRSFIEGLAEKGKETQFQ